MGLVHCLPTTAVGWQTGSRCAFADELAVFRLPLTTVSAHSRWLDRQLTDAERRRADRYRQPADRLRFVGGRGLLRAVAARYSPAQPAGPIRVHIGPTHKPTLPDSPDLHVSLAHAGAWIVLAVGREPVGVDVEQISDTVPWADMAEVSFGLDEQRALTTDTDPRGLFYALWTRKEALVKATAVGITDAFDRVPALPGPHAVAPGVLADTGAWTVRGFSADHRHPAALAHRPTDALPVFYEFAPDAVGWCR